MADLLYRWPEAAAFGGRVSKDKIYENGAVRTTVRERFIGEVQRITWAYKLAESTINLPASTEVPEIQVFRIDAKTRDVSDSVLSAIDKAIRFPILFEIVRTVDDRPQVRMTAAHKQLGTGQSKISTYYTTRWLRDDVNRHPLPTAITLPGLYAALLDPLVPITPRPSDTVSGVAEKLAEVRKLEREVAALERRLKTEPQFNRKLDIRRTLKTKQLELASLVEG